MKPGTTTISPTVISRAMGIINIQASPYNAQGDGVTDDTASIQAALDAAEVIAAAGGFPLVFVPEGTYIVGTAITAGNSALVYSNDNCIIRGPGTIKLADGSGADSVLLLSGDYNTAQNITIDGNALGIPTGRGECLRITGDYNTALNMTAQNSSPAGNDGVDFMILSGTHNRWIGCTSRNAGYNAFDNRGDYTTLRDCIAINFGTHGFNQAGLAKNQFTIDGFYATTASLDATAVIVDPGSGQADSYVKQATIKNVRILMTGATASLAPMKCARVHDLLLDNVFITQVAAQSTIKIVEGCRNVTIRDSYFSRSIDFDELSPANGAISAAADNGSGFTRFSSTSHGLQKRDIIYIPDSSVAGYNGVHEVTSVTTNTFDTDFLYTATATGNFYDCQGHVTLERVQIGEPSTTNSVFLLSGLRAPKLTMRGCRFYGGSTKAISYRQTYPISAVERIDVENCLFVFNRAASDAVVLSAEDSSDYFTASRKIRWVNNTARNMLNSTVKLTKTADSDVLLTSLDGGRDYIVPAGGSLPAGTVVSWQVGDRFWKPDVAAGASPGWICTTAGTFSAGTFRAMAAVA